MTENIGTSLDVTLLRHKMSTIRTWLLIVNLITANGSPFVATFTEISDISKSYDWMPNISRIAVGRAVRELAELGMITHKRVGSTSVIELVHP